MILLFFAANGHHTLLRMLITSGDVVPFGEIVLNIPELTETIIKLFVECTILGIKLSMPILVAELLGQLGMGVLMKVIPQINIFSINIELKVIVGLGLLLILVSPISEFLLQAEMTMLESLDTVLRLSAG
jgi:flagellar biosynthetic protein FliR